MNPRLKTSKKWTTFPGEYLKQIQEVFSQGFKKQLANAKLIVDGRIYPEEILLRVGILEKGQLTQANFEVSMDYSPKSKDAVDRIYDCIDAAASMMHEYFENLTNPPPSEDEGNEADFPRTWKEFEFNGKPLFLQFSTENSELEAQANALLGDAGEEDLVNEEDDEDDEDLDEASGPSMFGGGKKKKKSDLH